MESKDSWVLKGKHVVVVSRTFCCSQLDKTRCKTIGSWIAVVATTAHGFNKD